MAKEQLYGIKFPFSDESWRGGYLDMNESRDEAVKSEILHIIFTPKGQRLRMPDFGTNLIKALFDPNDNITWDGIKDDISSQVSKYIPNVSFKDISVYKDEQNDNKMFAIITYSVINGNKEVEYKISVPIV